MTISVIIPTYQEKENIKPLIISIEKNLVKLGYNFNIVVCDDNSPDKTGEEVKKLISDKKNLFLTQGKKQGLGKAIVRGMNYSIKNLKSEVVVVMDSDLSHDPAEIGKLIREIECGADFVVGSRYITGGSINADWSSWRRLISSWGNRFARYLVGLNEVLDCTSGFRAVKTSVLEKINLNSIQERGYSFQVRLLFEAKKLDAKIVEVPITFAERKSGTTKLGVWDIIEFIVMSIKIGLKRIIFR